VFVHFVDQHFVGQLLAGQHFDRRLELHFVGRFDFDLLRRLDLDLIGWFDLLVVQLLFVQFFVEQLIFGRQFGWQLGRCNPCFRTGYRRPVRSWPCRSGSRPP
jgi:hypothetical protein